MEAIKKLRDKNIFNDQSIVESMIQKNWMGSTYLRSMDRSQMNWPLYTDLGQKQQDSKGKIQNK